jgi:hypothetical protein
MWSTINTAQSIGMLQKIVFDTVTLDLQIQQQKASFTLCGVSELFRANGAYDPATMEVRLGKVSSSNRPQYMCLLIAPLLAKSGTSEGKDYSTFVVIEKAQVDIEIPSSGSGRRYY